MTVDANAPRYLRPAPTINYRDDIGLCEPFRIGRKIDTIEITLRAGDRLTVFALTIEDAQFLVDGLLVYLPFHLLGSDGTLSAEAANPSLAS